MRRKTRCAGIRAWLVKAHLERRLQPAGFYPRVRPVDCQPCATPGGLPLWLGAVELCGECPARTPLIYTEGFFRRKRTNKMKYFLSDG
jgi:hypothetical protein